MENKETAIKQVFDCMESTINTFEKEVLRAQKNKDRKLFHLSMVKEVLPKFELALKEFGLEIKDLSFLKTGFMDDWKEGDHMKVGVVAIPFNKKLKFLTENGFDSQGRGRNHKKLNEKANKIKNHIKEVTGLESVDVNQFSLEVENQKESKRVLIDFWVK